MSKPVRITCHYCGTKALPITKDHIVPRALGGSNAPWNIVQSCLPCNQVKADKWPTCGCVRCKYATTRLRRFKPAGKLSA